MPRNTDSLIDPVALSAQLGQEFPPTEQQAAVIGAPTEPLLVVAGAGAGKTETMAARVVWLVANNLVRPDQVLGLTFTRKAAAQLKQRIRQRLIALRDTVGIPMDEDGNELPIEPTALTYDSYAGRLIREYGLMLPAEPTSRVLSETEFFRYCRDVVNDYPHPIPGNPSPNTVIAAVRSLAESLNSHLVTTDDVLAAHREYADVVTLPKGKRQRKELTDDLASLVTAMERREHYLKMVEELRRRLREDNADTFNERMRAAATIAQRYPQVGYRERRKFRVVMLDEYQDTSHAQRVLLASLFGGADPNLSITAVGDPMQSIYGWRGATASNLTDFVYDFPRIDESGAEHPAAKTELTTSWRNPNNVLALANAVSDEALGKDPSTRPVAALTARPNAENGDVKLAWFGSETEEINYVADAMAQRFFEVTESGESFTGAVLVRNNYQIPGIARALRDRGVPVEQTGLSGLLYEPEVADLVALARMLVDPSNDEAALRIIGGAMLNLGLKDLDALSRRAKDISRRVERSGTAVSTETDMLDRALEDIADDSPEVAKLRVTIAEALSSEPDAQVGLCDALADLGEKENYSEEGYRRLSWLASRLRFLRRNSLSKTLGEIFADIERTFNLRTEALVRRDPSAEGAVGTAQLDRFAEEVAALTAQTTTSLVTLLDYLELAKEHDKGLSPAEIPVRSDRVQILTVHKAKGLEWNSVAVMGASNKYFIDMEISKRSPRKHANWTKDAHEIPVELHGSSHARDGGVPQLDLTGCEDQKEATAVLEQHDTDLKHMACQEAVRLFYVAATRAEEFLLITGSVVGQTTKPFATFLQLKEQHPEWVDTWWESGSEEDDSAQVAGIDDATEAQFPPVWAGDNTERKRAAAQAVRAAMHRDSSDLAAAHSELTRLWNTEIPALIAEHEAAKNPEVTVELTRQLSTSELVALKADPEDFARRLYRPIPFKPNAYAKRGTALHQWIEDRFGATALLDDDQLPGSGEEDDVREKDLERLKEKFLQSEWADRTPRYVEQPFEISLGGRMVLGRIDAIFHEGDDESNGWIVVDWKTGAPPKGEKMKAAIIQLAVYRLAWARLLSRKLGTPVDVNSVRAAFHYVAYDHTLEPSKLPDEGELAALITPPRERGTTRAGAPSEA